MIHKTTRVTHLQNSEPEIREIPRKPEISGSFRKPRIESLPVQSAQPVKAQLRISENISVPTENSTTKQIVSQPLVCFLLILVHFFQGA